MKCCMDAEGFAAGAAVYQLQVVIMSSFYFCGQAFEIPRHRGTV